MRLHKFIIISLIVTAIVGLIWLGSGYLFMKKAIDNYPTRIKASTLEVMKKNKELDTNWYNSLRKKDITIISSIDGIRLQGTIIYNPTPTKNTIVFSHGITEDRWSVLKGQRLQNYLKQGYNVLTFDQRAHGKSEGANPTYGFLEKRDLDQWVDTVARIFPNGVIGVEGVSMGAAIAVLHAGEINPQKKSPKKVAFYVFDSPYTDLEEQLSVRLNKDYHLPNLALTTSLNILNRTINGFSINAVSPIKAANRIDVPVLFVHGMADTYVPTYMSEELYEVVKSPKMLYLVPNARHAQVPATDSSYWKIHNEFIYKKAKQDRQKVH